MLEPRGSLDLTYSLVVARLGANNDPSLVFQFEHHLDATENIIESKKRYGRVAVYGE